jgi:hypothetical protein
MKRINHQEGYSVDDACANGAESNWGITTTSRAPISPDMRKKRRGARISAASPMAIR